MKRKLLSILSADVAEYSRHVHENEDAALSRLASVRALMDAAIKEHSGRIANTAGDSVIAEFQSATEAVSAAVAIQIAIGADNERANITPRLQFRIGINLGEVAVQPNGDLLGDGVNVAARLQTMAAPGGICLSENVYQQVRSRLAFSFSKLGEHRLKNISGPISVYAVNARPSRWWERTKATAVTRLRSPWVVLTASAASLLAFGAITIRAVYMRPQSPNQIKFEQTLRLKPAQEILSTFDLVAEGAFEDHHYYIIRTWGMTVQDQIRLASALGGYPVAIGSERENQFVFTLSLSKPGFWIEEDGQASGPEIGLVQRPGSEEPGGGWYWIDGEAVTYSSWKRGGPDNWAGNQSVAQYRNVSDVRPSPNWDDIGGERESFVVEVPKKG
jgi:class 3 adenylate cyclase